MDARQCPTCLAPRRAAQSFSAKLRRALLEAPAPLQRRYVRGLVSEIIVDREKAVITGPKAAIAVAVTAGAIKSEVPTFVWEWRALGESNPSCKIENLES